MNRIKSEEAQRLVGSWTGSTEEIREVIDWQSPLSETAGLATSCDCLRGELPNDNRSGVAA